MMDTYRSRSIRFAKGAGIATAAFVVLGTVSALWENPLFIRMTPAGSLEIILLAALSLLLGVYVAIRRPGCSVKSAGAGGVLGFLGVACPVCNKILLVIFGSELLLAYFEPVRLYVAGAGVTTMAFAVAWEWVASSKSAGSVADAS